MCPLKTCGTKDICLKWIRNKKREAELLECPNHTQLGGAEFGGALKLLLGNVLFKTNRLGSFGSWSGCR